MPHDTSPAYGRGGTSWRHGLTTRIVLGASPCLQEAHPSSVQERHGSRTMGRKAARVLWYSIVLKNPSLGIYVDPRAPYIPRERSSSTIRYNEVSHRPPPTVIGPCACVYFLLDGKVNASAGTKDGRKGQTGEGKEAIQFSSGELSEAQASLGASVGNVESSRGKKQSNHILLYCTTL